MEITGHKIEVIKDPTGILIGDRYEIILSIEVPLDDELYSENGVYLKVILAVTDEDARIAQYQIFENETNRFIELELEEDEVEHVLQYCKTILSNESH